MDANTHARTRDIWFLTGAMAMGGTVEERAEHSRMVDFLEGYQHGVARVWVSRSMDGQVSARNSVIGYMYIVWRMHA